MAYLATERLILREFTTDDLDDMVELDAAEGSSSLIRKGFTELGVQRVYAETMAVNTASRRVMEKAGLRYVRTFHADWPDRIPGDEHGDVEYALTRDQWAGS